MNLIDASWLLEHPLPTIGEETDKNARGRMLSAGGSLTVPGALALTGEAALRAGAGKALLAAPEPATLGLGIAMPEAAVFPLPTNDEGELAGKAGDRIVSLLDRCDSLVLGPGMGEGAAGETILRHILAEARADLPILLDAAVIASARGCADAVRARTGRVVLTPHPGEMIALMDCDAAQLRDAPDVLARRASTRFGAVVVLKQAETWVAAPDGALLHYRGGGPGLATAGSGDVLAGIVGGLMARGAAPCVAAAWAVWLHGEAGRGLVEEFGAIGFLARELPPRIPSLIAAFGRR